MPLTRFLSPAMARGNGDVEFTMVTRDGVPVGCVAYRDYLIAIAPDDRPRRTAEIFEELHKDIESDASDQYDLCGGDENGVVRLAPIVF